MPDGGSIISNTTSFIPKTRFSTGSNRTGRGTNFDLGILISGFILLVSLALFGGVYLYKTSAQKGLDETITSLEKTKKAFEPDIIAELSRLSTLINSVKTIFIQHRIPSKILGLLSKLTQKDVFFLNFSYSVDNDKTASIKMIGEANSYTSVASQVKIFEEDEAVQEVSFSNLSLKEAGKVGFNIELIVKPEFLKNKL